MPVRKVASMAACLLASTRIDAGERFTALYETTKLVKCVIMLDGWLESRGIRSFLVVLIVSLNKLQHSCNPFFQFEILSFFFLFHVFRLFLLPLVFIPLPFFRHFTFVRFSLVGPSNISCCVFLPTTLKLRMVYNCDVDESTSSSPTPFSPLPLNSIVPSNCVIYLVTGAKR